MSPFLLALIPSALLAEVNHSSDISQHFGPNPSNYGYSTVSVFAHWDIGKSGYLDIGDGHTIGGGHLGDLNNVTQIRAGLRINLK